MRDMQTNHSRKGETIDPTAPKCISLIGKKYAEVLLEHIRKARESIDIMMFDWRFYEGAHHIIQQINRELIHAANNRGVKVRAIVNFGYIMTPLADTKIKIVKSGSPRTMHNKVVIIDKTSVYVGSHNLTLNGSVRNHEASVLVVDPVVANDYLTYFNHLYGLYS